MDPAEPVDRGPWEPFVDELTRRRLAAAELGGPRKLERQRRDGRLDAHARVVRLLDAGSFRELGLLAGSGVGAPRDAFVAGTGTVGGRPVAVGAEDFTVEGGSIGSAGTAKRERLIRLARTERMPLVFILDGAGHRPTNALERKTPSPNDLQALAGLAGLVPMVTLVMGPSAGHGALAAPLADYCVMVEGTSQLFTAGPPLVKAATGEDVDKETLGGHDVAVASGVVHDAEPTDAEAIERVRRYLSYFGSSAWERPPHVPTGDRHRRCDALYRLVSPDARRPYDIHQVLDVVFDAGSVLTTQRRFGTSIVTALARLGGHAVAVVANQPKVRAGAIDTDAATKAARFIDVAAAFHLPLVLLADNPGVLAGTAAERAGVLRAAARLFVSQHRHPGPKLHVTLRKAFGFGSSAMGQNPFDGQDLTVAFPAVTLGAMPARPAAAASGASDDETARLTANEAGGPWRLADTLSYDDVIDPAETRDVLLDALERALAGRAQSPAAPLLRPPITP